MPQTTAFDVAFELASSKTQLGRIYDHAGHSERAMPILSEAVRAWERLVRQAANLSPSETIGVMLTSEAREAKQRREACALMLDNLATALDDLATALMAA